MSDIPIVSVLMTSYNREKYIAEAIKSVLASTLINFELIIVDDNSKDNTVSIAQSFANTDNRVDIYVNKTNIGDYPNRNKAASYAKGKYLKYVDADDLIYPFGLEILTNSMQNFPDAGWGLCSLNQNDKKIFPFLITPKQAYEYHYFKGGLFNKAPLSSIIKRDVFESIKGFNSIRMAGDYDMWHRLAQKYPLVLMPQGIVWYRKHDAQEMNIYHRFRKVYNEITNTYLKNEHCPLDEETILKILKEQQQLALKSAFKSMVRLNFKIFGEELNYYKSLL